MAKDIAKEIADQLMIEQHQYLLNKLAGRFSEKTQVMEITPGTRAYRYSYKSTPLPLFEDGCVIKTVDIPVYPFFGLMVGYDADIDLLVFWDPRG